MGDKQDDDCQQRLTELELEVELKSRNTALRNHYLQGNYIRLPKLRPVTFRSKLMELRQLEHFFIILNLSVLCIY